MPFLQIKSQRGSKYAKQDTCKDEYDLQHYLFETSKTEVSGVAAIKDFTAFLMPSYIILHLFSGRRRFNDLQAQLEYITAYEDYSIITLSLDLAVDEIYGNLADKFVVAHWIQQVRSRLVVGIVAGPPCETWSSARHNQLHERSPPPLRSEQAP